jgi:peroxiredoxin
MNSNAGKIVAGAAFIFLLAWFSRGSFVGAQAPAFTLRGLYGGDVNLADYRGRSVLLVFWSTSCGICRNELPVVDRLSAELSRKGVSTLTINIADVAGARQFLAAEHIGLATAVDPTGEVARSYGVSGVPRLVLVGPDGKIKHSRTGYTSHAQLSRWAN